MERNLWPNHGEHLKSHPKSVATDIKIQLKLAQLLLVIAFKIDAENSHSNLAF